MDRESVQGEYLPQHINPMHYALMHTNVDSKSHFAVSSVNYLVLCPLHQESAPADAPVISVVVKEVVHSFRCSHSYHFHVRDAIDYLY